MKRLIAILTLLAGLAAAFPGADLWPVLARYADRGTPIDPIAWYKAENNTLDSSPSEFHAAWGDIAYEDYVVRPDGYAFKFTQDSNLSRVVAPNVILGITTNTGFTVSSWVYVDDTFTTWGFFAFGAANYAEGYRWSSASGEKYVGFRISMADGSIPLLGNVTLVSGQWHHVAHVLKNNVSYRYLNGVFLDSASLTGEQELHADFTQTTRILMGVYAIGGASFNGAMGDIRVYRVPLSQSNISRIMAGKNAIEELQ